MAVLFATLLLDLLVRFGLPFSLHRVLVVEAVLFPAAALAGVGLIRAGGRVGKGLRTLQLLGVAGLFLAGLRSGLWASGMAVSMVNLVVLGVAAAAWLGIRFLRGKKG